MSNQLTDRINQFFGENDIAWATPGTDAHTSNFYGTKWINSLTRDEVANLVDCAMESVVFEKEEAELTWKEQKMIVLEHILKDLQLDKPELDLADQVLGLQEAVNSNQVDLDITLDTFLQEYSNIPDAMVDAAGNCWAGGWLSEEETQEFIEWVKNYD